jgi:hypothetical protein
VHKELVVSTDIPLSFQMLLVIFAPQVNSNSSFTFNMGVKGIIFPDKLAMNLLK